MIKNLFSILCQDFIEEKDTRLITYIKQIESVASAKLPVRIPFVSLCTLWQVALAGKKEEIFKVRLSLKSPKGKKEILITTNSKSIKKSSRERINFKLDGMPIVSVGVYTFILEYQNGKEWEIANEVDLIIANADKNVGKDK
ncbi:MAG: hypothetical protein KAS13_02765 [Candidatus Omnitrophica bacterium]|nr:hypothetical protein [Candidatus Omnitrophota bacterium]